MKKVAVVTGAAGGIGKAVAKRLAESTASSIALVDLKEEQLKAAASEIRSSSAAETACYPLDISDPRNIVACMAAIAKDLGPVSYMVNCAGISTSNLLVDVPVEEWDRVFSVNTRSAFMFSREAAKNMIAAKVKHGRIISISSQASKIGELGNGAYCASKAAINSFTQVFALELAQYGIAVTAICPGYVNTEMMQKVFRERGPLEGMTPEGYRDRLLSGVPSGKMVEPSEIAGLISYLCSEEADQVTGIAITIAGGKTII